jgi:hypothetical protein
MESSRIFIAVALVVLLVIYLVIYFLKGKRSGARLSPLAGLAFGFVLAGILFGENRLVGYGLMGIGVLLALVDIFRKQKSG